MRGVKTSSESRRLLRVGGEALLQSRSGAGFLKDVVKNFGLPRYHGKGLYSEPCEWQFFCNSGGTDDFFVPEA